MLDDELLDSSQFYRFWRSCLCTPPIDLPATMTLNMGANWLDFSLKGGSCCFRACSTPQIGRCSQPQWNLYYIDVHVRVGTLGSCTPDSIVTRVKS